MRGWGRLGVAKKGNSFIAFFSIFSIEFFYSMRAKLSLYKCWRPQLEKNKSKVAVYFRSPGDIFLFN